MATGRIKYRMIGSGWSSKPMGKSKRRAKDKFVVMRIHGSERLQRSIYVNEHMQLSRASVKPRNECL